MSKYYGSTMMTHSQIDYQPYSSHFLFLESFWWSFFFISDILLFHLHWWNYLLAKSMADQQQTIITKNKSTCWRHRPLQRFKLECYQKGFDIDTISEFTMKHSSTHQLPQHHYTEEKDRVTNEAIYPSADMPMEQQDTPRGDPCKRKNSTQWFSMSNLLLPHFI